MTRDTLWWERLLETRPKMGRQQPHSCVRMQEALARVRNGLCHHWSFLRLPESDVPARPASAGSLGPAPRGFIASARGHPSAHCFSGRCGISCSNPQPSGDGLTELVKHRACG
uniref:Uncharacterized protein n=1 Tax=Piliocolobus tephrosceles TaxID=591936 RepID=A0A8C9J5Y4_9PRIM